MGIPKEIVRRWVAAFDSHDAEAAVELYSENAINFQVAVGAPVQGKELILADLRAFFNAFPNSYTKAENIFEDGDWAIVEWIGGGTFLGEFYGNPPTGFSFQMRGCGFFHIPNGKIEFQRGYWDKASWFSQIGLSF